VIPKKKKYYNPRENLNEKLSCSPRGTIFGFIFTGFYSPSLFSKVLIIKSKDVILHRKVASELECV